MKDADGNPMELSDQTALDMINIIYTMELTRFQKYESTTVATNISQETMTEINENAADLKGCFPLNRHLSVYTMTVCILLRSSVIQEKSRKTRSTA